MNKDGLTKMTFILDAEMWHGSATETVWVATLQEGSYRLENSPFYAFDVSYQDVLRGKREGGSLLFDGVISRGGHSTYRIIKNQGSTDRFSRYWTPLQDIGCTFEEGLNGLLSIDIPPETDIYVVYERLERGEQEGAWSFEEAHCGHATDGGKTVRT